MVTKQFTAPCPQHCPHCHDAPSSSLPSALRLFWNFVVLPLFSSQFYQQVRLLQSQQLQMHHEGWKWCDKLENYGRCRRFSDATEACVSRGHAAQCRDPPNFQLLPALLPAGEPNRRSWLQGCRCMSHSQVESITLSADTHQIFSK